MTRLVHTADTHVGYQQYHSPERRADFLRAFESVVDDAVAADVDGLVHAGDLFHDRRPGLVDVQGVVAALRRLDDAGIPFLAVVGNHETKRDAQWLDLFEDLGLATRLGRDPVVVDDVALYGQDFVPTSRREDLDYDFRPVEDDAVSFAALVSHGAFEPFAHADWDTGAVLSGAPVTFDALLLGDVHHPGREEVDGVPITYPGSTERASAEEREERGYNLVEFDADAAVPVSITRRSVAGAREFVFVDLDLAAGEGEPRVREAVRQHDVEDAVLIVTIDGEGDPVTPASIEELALERGAVIARVNDRREMADDDDTHDVTFADPDRAVDRRLAELGLSEAARDLDGLVRTTEDVPVSRIRETAKRRVEERLTEAPESLESVETDTEDGADLSTADGDDGARRDSPESETDDSTAGGGSAEAADLPEATAATDRATGGNEVESGPTEGAGGRASEETTEDTVEEESTEAEGVDQASMEEFL